MVCSNTHYKRLVSVITTLTAGECLVKLIQSVVILQQR